MPEIETTVDITQPAARRVPLRQRPMVIRLFVLLTALMSMGTIALLYYQSISHRVPNAVVYVYGNTLWANASVTLEDESGRQLADSDKLLESANYQCRIYFYPAKGEKYVLRIQRQGSSMPRLLGLAGVKELQYVRVTLPGGEDTTRESE